MLLRRASLSFVVFLSLTLPLLTTSDSHRLRHVAPQVRQDAYTLLDLSSWRTPSISCWSAAKKFYGSWEGRTNPYDQVLLLLWTWNKRYTSSAAECLRSNFASVRVDLPRTPEHATAMVWRLAASVHVLPRWHQPPPPCWTGFTMGHALRLRLNSRSPRQYYTTHMYLQICKLYDFNFTFIKHLIRYS